MREESVRIRRCLSAVQRVTWVPLQGLGVRLGIPGRLWLAIGRCPGGCESPYGRLFPRGFLHNSCSNGELAPHHISSSFRSNLHEVIKAEEFLLVLLTFCNPNSFEFAYSILTLHTSPPTSLHRQHACPPIRGKHIEQYLRPGRQRLQRLHCLRRRHPPETRGRCEDRNQST
jgi:hypothetical protein